MFSSVHNCPRHTVIRTFDADSEMSKVRKGLIKHYGTMKVGQEAKTSRERFSYSVEQNKNLKERSDMDHATALLAGLYGNGRTTAAEIVCYPCGREPHERSVSDLSIKPGAQELARAVLSANGRASDLNIGNSLAEIDSAHSG